MHCVNVAKQSGSTSLEVSRSQVNPRMASLHLLFFLTCSNLVLIRGVSLSLSTLHFTSGHSFTACLETASWKTLYPFAFDLGRCCFSYYVLCVFYAFKWYCRALLSSRCLHLELRLYRPHILVSYSLYHYICGIWSTMSLVKKKKEIWHIGIPCVQVGALTSRHVVPGSFLPSLSFHLQTEHIWMDGQEASN